MARFDVYRRRDRGGMVLDCQSDILGSLNTRSVVPLQSPAFAPMPVRRLSPIFDIEGKPHVMVTQFAAAVPVRELGDPVVSLIDHDTIITGALDFLTCGF